MRKKFPLNAFLTNLFILLNFITQSSLSMFRYFDNLQETSIKNNAVSMLSGHWHLGAILIVYITFSATLITKLAPLNYFFKGPQPRRPSPCYGPAPTPHPFRWKIFALSWKVYGGTSEMEKLNSNPF